MGENISTEPIAETNVSTTEQKIWTKEERSAIELQFLNSLYRDIHSGCIYLWLKKDDEKITIPFDLSEPDVLFKMAEDGIKYNDEGYNVFFSVCTTDKMFDEHDRASKENILGQLATWADIDVEGGDHKKSKLPPDFNIATSFLPLSPSILVHSGYGLHAYYLFPEMKPITNENLEESETLNKNLIDVIRLNAGDYKNGVDYVQDLTRVMRLPGTYNYKLGRDDAPLCHIITTNDVRYTPQELREKIDALLPSKNDANKKRPSSMEKLSTNAATHSLSDDEVIEKIRHSKQGELFQQLFDSGDISKYNNDDSVADMALMSILPFWTHGDRAQMERIFSRSVLAQRDKWQEREDYRERTINKALETWNGECYRPDYKSPSEEESTAVPESLELERDRNGIVIKTINNCVKILQNDSKLSGLIAFDRFTYKITKKKTAPWEQLSSTTKEWSDNDDAHLHYYIERKYNISPNKKLDDAIIVVAEQNAFHPVREYLENLPDWDGVERAETLFIRVLEIPDNAYSRSISFHWLKAAIHRVLKPGCKFDYCLVIAGKQGIGKSSLFARLGGCWFNDSMENINGKDAIEQLIGSWIIELGEMQATRKADNETIKAFISRRTDRIRLPYGHRSIDFPRQCVFAATTNDNEPLKDKTGGRRFWILTSLASSDTTSERMNILDDTYIQQVWAEVYYKYNLELKATGKIKLLPPSEILVEATKIQEELTEGSEMIDLIRNYLDTPIPEKTIWDSLTKRRRQDFIKNGDLSMEVNERIVRVVGTNLRQEVCSAEVAYELFDIDNLNKEKTTLREINTILSNLDNWHKHSGGKRMGIYGSQKNVYVRENPFA